MAGAMDVDELFDEVTGTDAATHEGHSRANRLPSMDTVPRRPDELLHLNLAALLQSAVALEKRRIEARRVDGTIIGTGEADFTKGNTVYMLNYKGKTFQLVDVPGIEGDESKYADMVREAVAKAHLVFYVNGTNKKPEKATAEKIRSYLRRGTQVCPLFNVRGSADSYEFEEDRVSLEDDGKAGAALKQTTDVLEGVLGKDVLLPGHCVQGLLAFSSLALNTRDGWTTIHPSRDRDLVIQQRNYLKHFASAKAMFDFSQMRAVAQVLHTKLGTFREDIVESNKAKVRELLVENSVVLQEALKDHEGFIAKVNPEFDKCRESISSALQRFERLVAAGRRNLWDEFFNDLSERADDIVAESFGDNDAITANLKKAFKSRQGDLGNRLQEQFKKCLAGLQDDVTQAMERLVQDIRRVEFQQQSSFNDAGHKAVYQATALDMDLGLKGWGSIALNVGSYAMTGAGIGSVFPGIGTVIGAIAGAVVGVLVSVVGWFTSKEKRIRKAQAQVQEKIDEVRDDVMGRLSADIKNLMEPVRREVSETTLSQIDALYASLARPLDIIRQQIGLMADIKNQVEKMPRGTIQAIRH
jgi:hypothetical protein